MNCTAGVAPASVPTGERWVMCNDCGTWKLMQKGNHHPWCGCGSDNFRWEDERDHNPEAPASSVNGLGIPACGGPLCNERDHHPLCSKAPAAGVPGTRPTLESMARESALEQDPELRDERTAGVRVEGGTSNGK